MLPKINPTSTKSWSKLHALKSAYNHDIRHLLEYEEHRFDRLCFDLNGAIYDFTKSNISVEQLDCLLELAKECGLVTARKMLFDGTKINETEGRAVSHTSLRDFSSDNKHLGIVQQELNKVESFTKKITDGSWTGYSGETITDIVNIGIGGSDLGPKMVCYALKPYWGTITPHFISNVDAQQFVETVEHLNPATTLFIIASKTFTTQETMTNAKSAREWFLENGGTIETIAEHFVAVSTNKKGVADFGIDTANMFIFWEWVGGRYSLWSSIGLIISCTIGFENFLKLLKGAQTMDTHFRDSDFENNVPIVAALIGVWYNNFLGYESYSILPYDHRLRRLPSYLQQADMESNGKYVDRSGLPVTHQTGQIIWGEPGTNGQHAFYQLIHQGTKIIPCEFIAFANAHHDHRDHHEKLLANFFAQAEALLMGKSRKDVETELGTPDSSIAPFKVFTGNRPSSSILMSELSPEHLGELIAFYEHKIFVQGIIWNIFSYDQWGVELGKQLAKPILSEIKKGKPSHHDLSTKKLMKYYQEMCK